MSKKRLLISVAAVCMLSSINPVLAADPPVQSQAQEQVYGSQLMTVQERDEYRSRMRAAKTEEERERIRAEHHKAMQVRAKERGVTLPAEPPAHGMGPGPGGGMGPGAGRGR